MTRKLSNKEILLSILCFFIGTVFLTGFLFLMLTLNESGQIYFYLVHNVNNIVTVAVSIGVLSCMTYVYFWFENKEVLSKCSRIFELFMLFTLAAIMESLIGKYVSPIARPVSFVAMMLVMLFSRRDAIFLNTVFAITVLIVDRYTNDQWMTLVESYSSFLSAFCAGIVAIFLFKNVKTRIGSTVVAFVLFIPVIIINAAMLLPTSEQLDVMYVLGVLLYSGLDCVFSLILFFFILPFFEILFAQLTPFRLRELTSDSAKLIKRLKTHALGTYNHSIVVAQLAEACASAIGEDPELARAAAYYHDVGKLKNPEYFSENQSDYNLHKELTPELSVDIIRSHTRDGAQLIRKNHLPEFFAEVAIEHHGTMPIKYFFAKALKMSDGELNMGSYSYAGNTPTSKIAAIIMIADASEAASRSLPERTPEKVEELVKGLIEERMNLDQFVDCDITMRELSQIASTIVSQLTGVYHSRVQYPKLTLSKK